MIGIHALVNKDRWKELYQGDWGTTTEIKQPTAKWFIGTLGDCIIPAPLKLIGFLNKVPSFDFEAFPFPFICRKLLLQSTNGEPHSGKYCIRVFFNDAIKVDKIGERYKVFSPLLLLAFVTLSIVLFFLLFFSLAFLTFYIFLRLQSRDLKTL